jgi:hypothetical protein
MGDGKQTHRFFRQKKKKKKKKKLEIDLQIADFDSPNSYYIINKFNNL